MRIAVLAPNSSLAQKLIALLELANCEVVLPVRTLNTPEFNTAVEGCDLLIDFAWPCLTDYFSTVHAEFAESRAKDLAYACNSLAIKRLVTIGSCLELGLREGPAQSGIIGTALIPYAHAKILHRRILEDTLGCQCTLVAPRLFYIVDYNSARQSLSSLIYSAIKKREPLTLGRADVRRDFLHIKQVICDLATIMMTPGLHGNINICGGMPISIQELCNIVVPLKFRYLITFDESVCSSYEPQSYYGIRTLEIGPVKYPLYSETIQT